LILLIPHIIADRKCQALGGLHHADNRLAGLQGKPYVGLHAGCWWLSRYAMPEHHHGDHIQREQIHYQLDTGMHRRSPSAMMTLPRARQHRPASSAHLPVADVQGDCAAHARPGQRLATMARAAGLLIGRQHGQWYARVATLPSCQGSARTAACSCASTPVPSANPRTNDTTLDARRGSMGAPGCWRLWASNGEA